eukprot:1856465-Rhodomonas_salina.1
MSQHLALPQHPRQPPRSLIKTRIAAQIKMPVTVCPRLAVPQHPRRSAGCREGPEQSAGGV